MFSAVKNFFLTFILALVVFGLIATAAVRLVVDNINGTLERNDGAETVSPEDPDDPGKGQGSAVQSDGSVLNILLIGTDYRSGVFSDYDPKLLKEIYGIEKEKVIQKPVPSDVVPFYIGAVSSDTYYATGETVQTGDGRFVIPNGFYSIDYRTIEADAVLLLRIDRSRRQITLTSFPVDAYIEAGGGYMKLSDLYGTYGVSVLKDAVHMLTGIRPEYYVSVDIDSFPRLVDAIDGVEYYVPERMKYTDYAGGIEIDLFKGTQTLDGHAALSLLMYRDYLDPTLSREKTCASFVKAAIAKAMTPGYWDKIGEITGIALDCVKTDLTGRVIIENIGFVKAFAGNIGEISPVTEQGTLRGETVRMFNPEKSRARFAGLN